MSKSPRRSAPPGLLSSSVCHRPTDGSLLLVLLRSDLPVVGARLRGLGRGKSRRGEARDHFVDVSATVADYEPDFQNPAGRTSGDMWRVQVDHHAARTVRIYRVGAGFLPYRCEIGLACCPEAVAPVIALSEIALAVEILDTSPNRWWTV